MNDMKRLIKSTALLIILGFCISCGSKASADKVYVDQDSMANNENLDTATFGAGCFWCVEAVFQEVKGVHSVKSGYAGGFVMRPEDVILIL